MANECRGNWYSTIFPDVLTAGGQPVAIPLGVMVIDTHQGSSFTGTFVPRGVTAPLTEGLCIRGIQEGTHIVRFKVKIGEPTYVFRGIITDSAQTISGMYIRLSGGGTDPGDTGTWEASQGGPIVFD
jgi:hypothetical protein